MKRTLCVIGAPSSAGAYAPGQEKAPMALRRHGLIASLATAGRVDDRGDLPHFRWRPDATRPKAMNLDAVRRTAAAVADQVGDALSRGSAALTLGGDCTIELGTVAGALRTHESVALATLTAAPNWRALTLTEINPDHAPDEEESFRRLINMLAAALA